MIEQKDYWVTLKTGRFSKRHWLEDYEGTRLTPKFQLKYHETVGPITRLTTNKGSYVYTQNGPKYLYSYKHDGFWSNIRQINDNVYALYYKSQNKNSGWYLYDSHLCELDSRNYLGVSGGTGEEIRVEVEQGWGILNENMEWLVEPNYEGIERFNTFGYCSAENADETMDILDTSGNVILKNIKCYKLIFLTPTYIQIFDGSQTGVINIQGEEVIPKVYASIELIGNFFKVRLQKWGLLDISGKVVFDSVYDEIIETPDKFVVRDFAKIEVQKTKEVQK